MIATSCTFGCSLISLTVVESVVVATAGAASWRGLH
uniref:Uncharacterized protein n=1 Tax=Lepeophtheirus salmonis TaxID=72036 RepID=A0A0K2VFV7_LEPSM